MSISLKGKVILITGASSGFGADAARLFAAEGASVVLAARRIDKMQAEVKSIQAAGGQAMATPVDINNSADIENMVRSVIENYGRIDILFNNAGFGRLDWFDRLNIERDVHTQISVNLTGLMEVTQAILPHMIAQGNGHIINMSSVAGWIAAPMYTVYAATKFGVRGFTDALRREMSLHGIQVSGIYPGPAVTEFGQHTGESVLKGTFQAPAWTYMTSEYVARRVVELAKNPRRALIIPWWFRPVLWLDYNFPGIVDWIVTQFFVKKYRKI
ncbi:MAG: SDR family NAD(P)-dependent oxidoreductase [Chloroflexi bacterium]|nr:SDR family NAD(P)-dependent oxidoreductase [Chloroflexota bacterium]